MNGSVSPLQKARFSYQPKLPAALRNGAAVKCVEGEKLQAFADAEKIAALFPSTSNMPVLSFEKADSKGDSKPIHVGVILSGGQAPGGHNVIAGLYDGIKSLNAESRLYGFKGGPGGLVDNNYVEITDDSVIVQSKDGTKHTVPADSVIYSVGYYSAPVAGKSKNVHIIGDAAKVGNLRSVIWGAWDVATKL